VLTVLGREAIDMVEEELQAANVREGFGARADAVLTEGKPKP